MADVETPTVDLKKLGATLKRMEEQLAGLHDQLREMQQLLAGENPLLVLERYWLDAWRATYHESYIWVHAKDRAGLKRLLRSLSPDEIKARIGAYLATDEPFLQKNKHSFGVFCSTINSYSGAKARQAVVGCSHQPRCSSEVEHTRLRNREMRA